MKNLIKVAGLTLVILFSSLSASAAQAAQKIGYVATANVMEQIAKKNGLQEKLRREFQARAKEVESLQARLKNGVDRLRRDAKVMSEKDRTKLQRDLQAMESDFNLKVKNLREDQARRLSEEQRKLLDKVQAAIQTVAKNQEWQTRR